MPRLTCKQAMNLLEKKAKEMVVAQLVEWLLPGPEIPSLNLVTRDDRILSSIVRTILQVNYAEMLPANLEGNCNEDSSL